MPGLTEADMTKFTLYTDDSMNPNHVRQHLMTRFKGFTEYTSKGTWLNETRKGVVFEVIANTIQLKNFKSLCKHLAVEFSQSVVLFTTQEVKANWVKGDTYDMS